VEAREPGEPAVCFVQEPDVIRLVHEIVADCTWKRRLRGGHGDDASGRQFLVVRRRARKTWPGSSARNRLRTTDGVRAAVTGGATAVAAALAA
jgi:hypothetical protein